MKLLSCLLAACGSINTDKRRPNIVFLFSDDQGYSDVPWKSSKVKMPHLDALRRRGMTIDGAYSQSRCSPSRVALMTGKYPWKIGVLTGVFQLLGKAGVRPKEKMLPEFLKIAGYDTHMYGKWHLGFCDERLQPTSRGFDTFHGFWGSGGIGYYSHQPSGSGKINDYWVGQRGSDAIERQSDLYSTDEFAKDTMEMLDRRVDTGDTDPFFAYVAFNAPHAPFDEHLASMVREYDNVQGDRGILLGMIYRMDAMIGRIVTKLEQSGEMDNTIIVFQSDNGPNEKSSAFPLRGGKSSYAEGGLRVPSLVVGPNIPAGTTLHRTQMMHLTDWLPTLLDYAGLDATTLGVDFDGFSFKDVFDNGADSPREDIMHLLNDKKAGIYRKGDFKFFHRMTDLVVSNKFPFWNHTVPPEGLCDQNLLDDSHYTFEDIENLRNSLQKSCFKGNCNREALLFNIKDDPYELVNIYDKEPDVASEMMAAIEAAGSLMESTIDLGDATDQATLGHAMFPENSRWTTWGWCNADDI